MKVTVKIDGRTFEVEVGALDVNPVQAVVDGETFEVWFEHGSKPVAATPPVPARSKPASPEAASASGSKEVGIISAKTITSPLPGVIVAVAVKAGVMVRAGEELCTIEAMKMKNVVRAKRAGQISAVFVSEGQHVKHRQPLMEFGE